MCGMLAGTVVRGGQSPGCSLPRKNYQQKWERQLPGRCCFQLETLVSSLTAEPSEGGSDIGFAEEVLPLAGLACKSAALAEPLPPDATYRPLPTLPLDAVRSIDEADKPQVMQRQKIFSSSAMICRTGRCRA